MDTLNTSSRLTSVNAHIWAKYARLLCRYCLELEAGQKLYVSSSILAEPLLKAIYNEATELGIICEFDLQIEDQQKIYYRNADLDHLRRISPVKQLIIGEFDGYLVIRAPYSLVEEAGIDPVKRRIRSQANKALNNLYMKRTADRSLKRTLCEFPTNAHAQLGGMTIEEFQNFIFHACKLDLEDPVQAWKEVGKQQQKIVEYLNQKKIIKYKNENTDIIFSVENRKWINSDGKTNMPSGEVFSAPVENSVNGYIRFDYPSLFMGREIDQVELLVENGEVIKWSAKVGQELLDEVFSYEGAKYFGEVAIGTNYAIQHPTRNILFDEKMGGTIHMAVGQSYLHCGGKNQSSIHFDMIADMRHHGEIIADGEVIYRNGSFLI